MYPIYSGSYSYLTEISARFGVELTFVDIIKEEDFVGAVERAIKPNTKVLSSCTKYEKMSFSSCTSRY